MNNNLYNYRNSTLLLRFLLLATFVFFCVVTALFFKQSEVVIVETESSSSFKKYSDTEVVSDVVKAYAFGAKIIHDVEAYPSLKNLFFAVPLNFGKNNAEVTKELLRVQLANKNNSDFGKTHVYSTSYYIGNLLVAPNLTLHAVLETGTKPQTAILLETILADVRSGVVKLQNYYDVAPPAHYDPTLAGALYFTTASFPSLTIAEATIVLAVLAELDTKNARIYEQFAHQYANQVFASGASFAFDIEFALALAAAYLGIAKEEASYKELIAAAKLEWLESSLLQMEESFVSNFEVTGFDYSSTFLVEASSTNSFSNDMTSKRKEEITGSLMLSLLDTRLPNPAVKLYQYNLEDQSLLPSAVDLQQRQFPDVASSVGMAEYLDEDTYIFSSGEVNDETGDSYFLKSRLLLRDKDKVSLIAGVDSLQSNPKLNLSKNKFIYSKSSHEFASGFGIYLASINNDSTFSNEFIIEGEKPMFVLGDTSIVFLRSQNVVVRNLLSGREQVIANLPKINGQILQTNLDYSEDRSLLMFGYSYLELGSMVPKTKILFFTIESVDDVILSELGSEITLLDSMLYGGRLSISGDYVSLLVSETLAERNPRLLIFDILSGIIKKEISVKSYSTKFMQVDGWVPFN